MTAPMERSTLPERMMIPCARAAKISGAKDIRFDVRISPGEKRRLEGHVDHDQHEEDGEPHRGGVLQRV